MEKTDNLIPSIEELTMYMEESAVNVTSAYGSSPVVLTVDDATIGTLGNFSASIGKAKSKKTPYPIHLPPENLPHNARFPQ